MTIQELDVERSLTGPGFIVGLFMVMLITFAGTSLSLAGDGQTKFDLSEFPDLPPATGAIEPRHMPVKGEDGIYHHDWFVKSFLNLKDDFNEARAKGRRLVLFFEQRGCSYCIKLQKETLSAKYVNDYVRRNFDVIQIDIWGDREVTDFDGTVMTEKKLAARWGVLFTPTIVFLKEDLKGLEGNWGRDLEILRLNQVGRNTIYDVFTWVKHRIYEKRPSFQRFHIARINQRRAMRGEKFATDGTPLKKQKTH